MMVTKCIPFWFVEKFFSVCSENHRWWVCYRVRFNREFNTGALKTRALRTARPISPARNSLTQIILALKYFKYKSGFTGNEEKRCMRKRESAIESVTECGSTGGSIPEYSRPEHSAQRVLYAPTGNSLTSNHRFELYEIVVIQFISPLGNNGTAKRCGVVTK